MNKSLKWFLAGIGAALGTVAAFFVLKWKRSFILDLAFLDPSVIKKLQEGQKQFEEASAAKVKELEQLQKQEVIDRFRKAFGGKS